MTRRIVCAALRGLTGNLVLGIRHYSDDMIRQINRRDDGAMFNRVPDRDQGFVDQHGKFLTREEAFIVADAAGQIINYDACPSKRLYTEGLY